MLCAGKGNDIEISEWATAVEVEKARKALHTRKAEPSMNETALAHHGRAAIIYDLYITAVRPHCISHPDL